MARYSVRLVSHAQKQYDSLPFSTRKAVDSAFQGLETAPYRNAKDHKDGSWSRDFPGGFVLYTVGDKIITVTVLRIVG